VWAILSDRLRAELDGPAYRDRADEILGRVASHAIDPFAGADALLGLLGR
jgi:hypothetical protein